MATNNQRAISWPSQHSSQMQSTVLISIIAIPSPPAPHSLPYPCFPMTEPSIRARLEFFSDSTMKEDARFLFAFSASPHKTKRVSSTPDRRAKTRRGDFYLRGAAGEAGGAADLQENPQEEKAGTGDWGSLYLFGVGRVQPRGCPRLRGRGERGRGRRGGERRRDRGKRCAEPLTLPCPCAHALRRCVFKQRKLHNQSPSVSVVCIPSAPLRWLSGGGGTSRPRALSPARPRLSPLPGALTPFHYCTARCDRDSSATGKEGQPGRWSQRWNSSCSGCRAGGTKGEPEWGGKILALSPSWPPPIGMMLGGSSGRGECYTEGSGSRTKGRQRARSCSTAPGPARTPPGRRGEPGRPGETRGSGPAAAAAPPRPDPALSPLPPPLSLGP